MTRWRIELSSFNYDIMYRPGDSNTDADVLFQISCSTLNSDYLISLHGRAMHTILEPLECFAFDDVKRMTSPCKTCAKYKLRCH